MIGTLNRRDQFIAFVQQAICNCLFYHENEEGPEEKIVPMEYAIEAFKLKGGERYTVWAGNLAEKALSIIEQSPPTSASSNEEHFSGIVVECNLYYRSGYGLTRIEEEIHLIPGSTRDESELINLVYVDKEKWSIKIEDENHLYRAIFIGKKGADDVVIRICDAEYEEGTVVFTDDEEDNVREYVME